MITLEDILVSTAGEATARGASSFAGVSIDGRTAKDGLYVAIIGEKHDGHDFIGQALAAGATGLLVQRGRTPAELAPTISCVEVDDPRVALGQLARGHRRRMGARVVGVTGSVGKTTTKQLCAAALGAVGPTLSAEGSLNNETGVPLTMLRLTPEHRFAVLEMGMRGLGQIAYLRGLAEPDVACVVNAGVAHVGLLGSPERIVQAKSEIWLGLPAHGAAIYPYADERLRVAAAKRGVPAARHVTFGQDRHATVAVHEIRRQDPTGSDVIFDVAGTRVEAHVPLPGLHNVDDAACALAVAYALGVPADLAADGLSSARPAAHRSAVVHVGQRHVFDDCYNANPASMSAAVDTLLNLARGHRAVAVVGDMLELGDESAEAHTTLGRQLAERGVAHVVAMGQYATHIAAGLAAVGGPTPTLTDDPVVAARAVAAASGDGDWILLKASRGMRLERVLDALRAELG